MPTKAAANRRMLTDKYEEWAIACNCLTKTPVPKHHKHNCPVWMSARIKELEEEVNLHNYRKAFVGHMLKSGASMGQAIIECAAHLDNVGVEDRGDPIVGANECMSYWEGS